MQGVHAFEPKAMAADARHFRLCDGFLPRRERRHKGHFAQAMCSRGGCVTQPAELAISVSTVKTKALGKHLAPPRKVQ